MGAGELTIHGTGDEGDFPPPPPPPLVDLFRDDEDNKDETFREPPSPEILSPPGIASPPPEPTGDHRGGDGGGGGSWGGEWEYRPLRALLGKPPPLQLLSSRQQQQQQQQRPPKQQAWDESAPAPAAASSAAAAASSSSFDYDVLHQAPVPPTDVPSAVMELRGGGVNWGAQRAKPGGKQWKAASLDHALHKLVKVTGAHANRLRVSAGPEEVEAERRRHLEEHGGGGRSFHDEEDGGDYSNHNHSTSAVDVDVETADTPAYAAETASENVETAAETSETFEQRKVQDERTPAQREKDEAAARAELASFAAGDRERMASRYNRGALLAEPMAGDVRWDVEELRAAAAEAAAEARWRGRDFGYRGASSTPGDGGANHYDPTARSQRASFNSHHNASLALMLALR